MIIFSYKIAGIVASMAIVGHFYLMYNFRKISISGLIAAIVMWTVFTLGIWCCY